MAEIDRTQLILDQKVWLPPSNSLCDAQMGYINDNVIALELKEDDEQYYPEALCKSLRAIGYANLSKATANNEGLKREKVGDEEQEWFNPEGSWRVWKDFIDNLKNVCPTFGYYGMSTNVGIRITSTAKPDINPCTDTSELTL